MKIQIASDLHLEGLQESLREKCPTLIAPAPDADLLVLAGDIHEDCAGIELFKDWPVPVLYVPGNHEFYGVGWRGALEHMRRACDGTGITLLDKDEVVIDGVRFLGATLWTDYKINVPTEVAMSAAQTQLLDYFRIKTQMGLLKARNTLDEHYNARSWLKRELEKPFDGTTVVITHHAPHPKSVAARYESDVLTGAFVSDLSGSWSRPTRQPYGSTGTATTGSTTRWAAAAWYRTRPAMCSIEPGSPRGMRRSGRTRAGGTSSWLRWYRKL
uniref:metallophosphoesterase n=1 Tax=Hylemonella sp. TaxID=2066020 RepID=UPI0035B09A8E